MVPSVTAETCPRSLQVFITIVRLSNFSSRPNLSAVLPLFGYINIRMGRTPYCDADGLKKGLWTPEEDQKLLSYIQQHGHRCWSSLPKKAGYFYFYFLPCIAKLLYIIIIFVPSLKCQS